MRKPIFIRTQIQAKPHVEGIAIEEMISSKLLNKEPIEAVSPAIFTLRADGVKPEYDIRTDKWEIAQEAMGRVQEKWMQQRQQNREKHDAK